MELLRDPVYFWMIIAILCGIIEALTLGLSTIWFAFGAIVTWLVAQLGVSVYIQIFIFLSVSSISLYYTRPLAKKLFKNAQTKTNVYSLIGEKAIVIEEINPLKGTGQVKVGGQIWSAKSDNKGNILKDHEVEIVNIEGVKLVVKKY